MKYLAVFSSGNGSNFEAIAEACRSGTLNAKAQMLITNCETAGCVTRANKFEIPYQYVRTKNRTREEAEKDILNILTPLSIDFIALAGYMRLLSPVLLKPFQGRILNVHPSLLPNFPGLNAIKRAYQSNVEKTGATIHYVDSGMDTGPIILQKSFDIKGLTLSEIEDKMHIIEHELYIKALKKLCNE